MRRAGFGLRGLTTLVVLLGAPLVVAPVSALAEMAVPLPPGLVRPWQASGEVSCSPTGLCQSYGSDWLTAVAPDGADKVSVWGPVVDASRLSGDGLILPDRADCPGCSDVRGVSGGVGSIAFSPDGTSVYLVGFDGWPDHGAIAFLQRDPATGAMVQPPGSAGCITEPAVDGCAVGRGMAGLRRIVVAGGGEAAYGVAPGGPDVVVFQRDLTTGQLSQGVGAAGCVGLDDTPASEACGGPVRGMNIPTSAVVAGSALEVLSHDGAGGSALVTFARAPDSGALVQLDGPAGCVNPAGAGGCTSARLPGNAALGIADDGSVALVSSSALGEVVVLSVAPDGSLTEPSGSAGCLSVGGTDGCGTLPDGVTVREPVALTRGAGYLAEGVGRFRTILADRGGLAVAESIDCGQAGCVALAPGDARAPADGRFGWINGALWTRDARPYCEPTATVQHDELLDLAQLCRDGDGGAFTTTGKEAAVGGFETPSTFRPPYTPLGPVAVTVTVDDGAVPVDRVIAVDVQDNPPYCDSGSTTTFGDLGGAVLMIRAPTCFDPDPWSLRVSEPPRYGAVSLVDGVVTYRPGADLRSSDSFSLEASDGALAGPPLTFTILSGPLPTVTLRPPRGLKTLGVGAYDGAPIYFSWAGHSVSLRWSVTSPPGIDVRTVARIRQTLDGAETIGGSGDGTAYLPVPRTVVVHAVALSSLQRNVAMPDVASNGYMIVAAMEVSLSGYVERGTGRLTARFGGRSPARRGSAYLERLAHRRWRRVRRLAIRGGVAHAVIPLDGAVWRVLYVPRDPRDLIPSYAAILTRAARAPRRPGPPRLVGQPSRVVAGWRAR